MGSLICGVGINNADYAVSTRIDGIRVYCPFHQKWKSMLTRCYSDKYHARYPTYIGCEVSEEWKTFSNFKAWMETQDWVGKHLDKDILFPDNNLYSSTTCVFVDVSVNAFLVDRKAARGEHLLGVSWSLKCKKFIAQCCDGFGNSIHLGTFTDELLAHLAWKSCKHKLACKLAEEQSDPRVAEALRKRFTIKTKGETNVS